MIDPFEKYEKRIVELKDDIRDMHKGQELLDRVLGEAINENRRLRDACRQTNKGISRLRRRCDSQTKKIAALKAIVREAMSRVDYAPPQHCIEAVEGRRPEKAT